VWVKKSPPPDFFLTFFQNGWEFLVQISHTYIIIQFTLAYKFLFSYLQPQERIFSTHTVENAQKVHPPSEFLGVVWLLACSLVGNFVRCHVQTVSRNMHIKYEVRTFNHKFVFVRRGRWPLVRTDRHKEVNTLYPPAIAPFTWRIYY